MKFLHVSHLRLFSLATLAGASLIFGACQYPAKKKSGSKVVAPEKNESNTKIDYKTAVLADVEGSWAKVQSFLDHTDVVKLIKDDPLSPEAELSENGKFVFIGDAIDHGPNPKKVLNFLMGLKMKYPERVHLILGNRDINKLRFNWELTDSALKLDEAAAKGDLARFRVPAWEQMFPKWLSSEILANGKGTGKFKANIDGIRTAYQHGKSPVQDRILKLKWMLEETLGAVNAFTNFQKESGIAKDADAIDSFLGMSKADGLLGKYLKLGELIYFDEDTSTVYVHGGINKDNIGTIPGVVDHIDDLDAWMHADKDQFKNWMNKLNAWAQEKIDAGLQGDAAKAIALIQYQEPPVKNGKWDGFNNQSVILARPWVAGDNLGMIEEHTIDLLEAKGVKRIVFGHSPVGDLPILMKSDDFEMVACDTSFANSMKNASVHVSAKGVFMTSYYQNKDKTVMTTVTTDGSLSEVGSLEIKDIDAHKDRNLWTIGYTQDGKKVKGYWAKQGFVNAANYIFE